MESSPWALVAVLLTVLAGLVGAFIENRREHSRWLRNERLRVYAEFLGEMDRYRLLLADLKVSKVTFSEFISDTRRVGAPLSLVGSELVLMFANAMRNELGEVVQNSNHPIADYEVARTRFVEAASWSAHTVSRRQARTKNRLLAGKRAGPIGRLRGRVFARLHRYDFAPFD